MIRNLEDVDPSNSANATEVGTLGSTACGIAVAHVSSSTFLMCPDGDPPAMPCCARSMIDLEFCGAKVEGTPEREEPVGVGAPM